MSRIKSAKATFDKLIKYSEILDKKGEFSLSTYLTNASNYHAKLITSQAEDEEVEVEEDIVPPIKPNDPNSLQPNPDAVIPEVINKQKLHDDLGLPFLKSDSIGEFEDKIFHHPSYISSFGPEKDKEVTSIANSLLSILKSKNTVEEGLTEALIYLQHSVEPLNSRNQQEYYEQFVHFNYALGLALAYYYNKSVLLGVEYFAKDLNSPEKLVIPIMSRINMALKVESIDKESAKSDYDKYMKVFEEEYKQDPTTVQSLISFIIRNNLNNSFLQSFNVMNNDQILQIYKVPIESTLNKIDELKSRFQYAIKNGFDTFIKIVSLQPDDKFTFNSYFYSRDIRQAETIISKRFNLIGDKLQEILVNYYDELKDYGIDKLEIDKERSVKLCDTFKPQTVVNILKLAHIRKINFNNNDRFGADAIGYALDSGVSFEEIQNSNTYLDIANVTLKNNNLINNDNDLITPNYEGDNDISPYYASVTMTLISSVKKIDDNFKRYPELYAKFIQNLADNNISIFSFFNKLYSLETTICNKILSENPLPILEYFTKNTLAIYNNGTNVLVKAIHEIKPEEMNFSPEEITLIRSMEKVDGYEKIKKIKENFPNIYNIPNYGVFIKSIISNYCIFDLSPEDKIRLLESFNEDRNNTNFPLDVSRTINRLVFFDNDYSYDEILGNLSLTGLDLRFAKFIGQGYKNSNNKILIETNKINVLNRNITAILFFFGFKDVESFYNNLNNLEKDGKRYTFDDLLHVLDLEKIENAKTVIEQKFPNLTPDNEEYNLVSSLLVKNPNITNFHTPVAIIKYIESSYKKDNISLPEFSKNISPTEYGFLIDDKNDSLKNIYDKNKENLNVANRQFNNLDTQIKQANWLINWYTKTPEEERNNTLPYGLNTTQYANPIEFQENYKSIVGYTESQVRFFASLQNDVNKKNKVRMFLLEQTKNNKYDMLFDVLDEVLNKEYDIEPFNINQKIEQELSNNINFKNINDEQIKNILRITEFFGNESEKGLNKFVTVKHFNPDRTKDDPENKTKFIELDSSEINGTLNELANMLPGNAKYLKGAKEYFLKNYQATTKDLIKTIIAGWNRNISFIDATTNTKISGVVSELSKQYSPADLVKFIKYDNFTNRLIHLEPKDSNFAVEFSEHFDSFVDNYSHRSEQEQNAIAHHKYEVLEQIFTDSQSVPMPDWAIDNTSSRGKYTARFLPRSDTRGMFLGQYTSCCQHPEGEAYTSAFDGQISPQACFFVVEDKTGKIHMQSYVWEDSFGNVCFDSFETGSNDFFHSENRKTLLKEMIHELVSKMGERKVTGGEGPYNNAYTLRVDSTAKKTPSLYNPYKSTEYFDDTFGINFEVYETDSSNQALIIDNRSEKAKKQSHDATFDRGSSDYDDLFEKETRRDLLNLYRNSEYNEDIYDEDNEYIEDDY
jgi:hypothetical protein